MTPIRMALSQYASKRLAPLNVLHALLFFKVMQGLVSNHASLLTRTLEHMDEIKEYVMISLYDEAL